MVKAIYPLKQIIEVKMRRVENAEKVVLEKRQALEVEQKKLAEREKERNNVKSHMQAKLDQLRNELDGGTTSPKIQQMKAYLKVVQEKLKIEEKKVADQKEQVKKAEAVLDEAIADLKRKRQEVDKLNTHKKDWEAEMRKEEEVIEGREQDELGSTTYLSQKRRYSSSNRKS